MPPDERLRQRRTRATPVAQALHKWPQEYRPKVPDDSATAKAMDYSLHPCAALTRYLGDPALPIDNNFDEQQIGHGPRAARTGFSLGRCSPDSAPRPS